MLHLVAAICLASPAVSIADRDREKHQDQQIHQLLREVINRGADLYNRGDANGCYRLYEGSLLTIRALADHRPQWQQAINDALTKAEEKAETAQRAFVLREVMDQIRDEAGGNSSN